ncbi:DinB family protein [Paenibacillus sp. UNC499MF]|uniref:DinB family protein n=1 Tax=Paenibacillus sp. UNC499MF TaxID=1502751 RepID=UPI0008A09330|nr:DinB family protein [Paenibacillus sp. UNC499MF]SEG79807.1 DinB superfamily protein [Paenibacillus sp. UNC499MF]
MQKNQNQDRNINTLDTLNRFEQLAETYIQELDNYSLEELTRKPDEDQWSLGQMYVHLIKSALYLHLPNMEACRTSSVTEEAAGKTERGEAAFASGSFPPIRIQVPPSKEYSPLQPESKEQLADGLREVIRAMRAIEPSIAGIPAANTVGHPGFGGLNAVEWFSLVEMHYRHHLLQKERLDAFLQETKETSGSGT